MHEKVIVDTSVLIALEKINLLDVLCKMYSEIILPEAVIGEFGTPPITCYCVKKVESPLARFLSSDLNLGKGESEVIALANETGTKTIIDDLKARGIAEKLGLKVSGTIGVLLKAESLGLINSAYEKIKELKENGFYVSGELLNEVSKFKAFK